MFLYALLLLHVLNVKGEKANCQMIGSPEYPQLSKDGDVIIGGAFSIHSKISLQTLSFIEKPQRLNCTRFVSFSIFVFSCTPKVIFYLS